jgi:hypothetical protein
MWKRSIQNRKAIIVDSSLNIAYIILHLISEFILWISPDLCFSRAIRWLGGNVQIKYGRTTKIVICLVDLWIFCIVWKGMSQIYNRVTYGSRSVLLSDWQKLLFLRHRWVLAGQSNKCLASEKAEDSKQWSLLGFISIDNLCWKVSSKINQE